MLSQAAFNRELSAELKPKKDRQVLAKAAKAKKSEIPLTLGEDDRTSANAHKQPLKELSIVLANYYDKRSGLNAPKSNKNDDAKFKNLFPAKVKSLLDDSHTAAAYPVSNLLSKTNGKIRSSKPEDHARLASASNCKPKKEDRSLKGKSSRLFNTHEDVAGTPGLARDKTIPKIPLAKDHFAEKSHTFTSHHHAFNQKTAPGLKATSTLKSCINSINPKHLKKGSELAPKPEPSYFNSVSGFSYQIDLNKAALMNKKTPKHEASLANAKNKSSFLEAFGRNKENERSNSNMNLTDTKIKPKKSLAESKLKYIQIDSSSHRSSDQALKIKGLHQPQDCCDKTLQGKNYSIIERLSKNTQANPHNASALKQLQLLRRNLESESVQRKIKSSRLKRDSLRDFGDADDQVVIEDSQTNSPRPSDSHISSTIYCDEYHLVLPLQASAFAAAEQRDEARGSSDSQTGSHQANGLGDPEILRHLLASEKEYEFSPHYLDGDGVAVKWSMRAMLLDWMVEVSNDFGFKRSTFYLAANYVDRYLCAAPQSPVKFLQLIGVTCLNLACKLEELYTICLADFSSTTLNCFSQQDIRRAEVDILKVCSGDQALKWRINPPTLFVWASWYTSHWDAFVLTNPIAANHKLVRSSPGDPVTFRQNTVKAYNLYSPLTELPPPHAAAGLRGLGGAHAAVQDAAAARLFPLHPRRHRVPPVRSSSRRAGVPQLLRAPARERLRLQRPLLQLPRDLLRHGARRAAAEHPVRRELLRPRAQLRAAACSGREQRAEREGRPR